MQQQVRQRDMLPGFHRLPGPLRQQITGHQAAHGFLESIVVPLVPGPVILFPGRGAQRVQHPPDHFSALRGQVPVQHPGTAERDRQFEAAVLEVRSGSSSGRSDRACSYISANSAASSSATSPATAAVTRSSSE